MSQGLKQLGRGQWLVTVTRVDPRTGKRRKRKRKVDGSRREAEAFRIALLAELEADAPRDRLRLAAYAHLWLRTRLGTIADSTANKYANSLDLHILPALGEHYVDALKPSDVAQYVQGRVDSGAAGNTVLNELRCIRTVSRDSVADGYAQRHWADRVKAPPVATYDEDDPNLLTAPELVALLSKVPEQWLPMVMLLVTTGMRFGECSGLLWEDIDWQAQEIHVRRINLKGDLKPRTKTKKRRRPPLVDAVAELLEQHRQRIEKEWRGPVPALVFPVMHGERAGKPHAGSPLRRILDKACDDAEVTRVTPHGLRRTFNDLARQFAARHVLQSITGHSTDAMTDHYSLVRSSERLAVSKRVLELTAGNDSPCPVHGEHESAATRTDLQGLDPHEA